MVVVTEIPKQVENFLAGFEKLAGELRPQEPEWLTQLRREAMEAFAELGFPTTRDEQWRFTNVAPIVETPFRIAEGNDAAAFDELPAGPWSESDAPRLVFLNGQYVSRLSRADSLPDGVEAGSLRAALNGSGEQWLRAALGRSADYLRHAFTALNTALWRDGAYVHIRPEAKPAAPIHLVHLSTADEQATASFPRTLVVAEQGAQATLVESYLNLGGGDGNGGGNLVGGGESSLKSGLEPCFTGAVSEIVAGENSVVDHYRLLQEAPGSFHVGTLQVTAGRSARYTSFAASFGGALVRNESTARLDAEGAECEMNGLYMARGREHVDNHTIIDHAQPHCTSRQLYHGILDERATAVFNGAIIVRQDAQKTNANQKNRNLLLSPDATIDTKPQLEISANDVRCTHGATVGQMDPEALFYLRSRGIALAQARELLIHAFAAELLEGIGPNGVRGWVERMLRAHLGRSGQAG